MSASVHAHNNMHFSLFLPSLPCIGSLSLAGNATHTVLSAFQITFNMRMDGVIVANELHRRV